ncbi:hypothetical protein [Methylomonas sp. TEB]|uniref:hypothetical protein n=1 Tax=Methylomonas sp. TEB TaxID=3398229 RepID=UPI0039F460B9
MTLDIRGGLKNTSISSNRYVVIEELLSNAIDSYLIRKNLDKSAPSFSVSFCFEFFDNSLLENDSYDLKISCEDNGAGFLLDQVKAFATMDSTYKDHLNIQGIGKCKGAGRIQFFHFFRKIQVESVCKKEKNYRLISLCIDENMREVSESDFKERESTSNNLETKITLQGLSDEAFKKHFDSRSLKVDFSADKIKNHLFITFMQRFIVLKGIVGDFCVSVTTIDGDNREEKILSSSDLPQPTSRVNIPMFCSHGNESYDFKSDLIVTRYSLPENKLGSFQHEVALCANSALVLSITKYYLRGNIERKRALDGNYELILIESEFLEAKVNEQRDGFKVPETCTLMDGLDGEISLQDIIDSLEDYVFNILTPKDFDKDALIDATQEKFGISRSMLNGTNIKVQYSDTEENIAKRVLKKYQEEIVRETSDIFSLKKELLDLDPRSKDFRERISELSWKYTSTIKKMDMANLSQLVVRRSSMLDVLERAVSLLLSCQHDYENRKQNERIIHNIFFPTGKDSRDSIDHDIWILNEEYHYFEHIASDKSLASIPWNHNENIFESDIDESLEALFAKNNKDNQLKRPDIAIFNQEGSAIIIEFKAPGVQLQEHIPDLVQYSRLLAAKSNGKIKKFYGYLIGDCMDETRMPTSYTRFPSGLGYFNTDHIRDQATGIAYGELYSEILFYNQFIDRAKNRLKVYKYKLNVDI